MKRFLSLGALGAFLLVPASVVPMRADDDRDDHHVKRYYDKDARDWHEWNENEDHAYHHYLEERHITVHDWDHAPARERRDYWRWRHAHPDAVVVAPDRH